MITGSLIAPNLPSGGGSIVTGTGIISINGQNAPAQLLTNGSTGTQPNWTQVGSNTNELNIPQASAAGVTAGLISNSDYVYFSDKVNRSGDTMTGDLIMDNCSAVVFNNADNSGNISLKAPCTTSDSNMVIIQLPQVQASQQYQVLANIDDPTSGGQLGWVTTITSAAAIELLYSATACDYPNTIVARDSTGSFVATTISLTGNSLIDYGSSNQCLPGTPFIEAPTNLNTIIGIGAGANNLLTGSANTAYGYNALANVTSGYCNTADGNLALQTVTTGYNNTGIGCSADVSVGDAVNRTAIGAGTTAGQDNSVVLGNSAVTAVIPSSNLLAELGQTGNLWASVNTGTVGIYDGSGHSASLTAAAGGFSNSYTLQLPTAQGETGQLLWVESNTGTVDQLGWTSVAMLVSGTACDYPNTIVARDSTGSFVATTISLTGNSLIDYGSSNQCLPGTPFIEAPTNQNTIIGIGAGANNALTGTANTAYGYNALANVTSGYCNTADGNNALLTVTTGYNNTGIGCSADVSVGDAVNRTSIGAGTIASQDNSVVLGNNAVTAVIPSSNLLAELGQAGNLWASVNTGTVSIYDGDGHSASLTAAAGGFSNSYTLQLPTTQGETGQLLWVESNTGTIDQLGWTSVTMLVSGTACDYPNTIVARDATGSFVATTISLTGNSLIDYGSSNQCLPGTPFIEAPTNQNTIIGIGAGANNALTGTANTVYGYNALANVTSGYCNTADGNLALQTVTTGYNNTGIGCSADVSSGAAVNRTAIGAGTIASQDNSVVLGNSAVTAVIPSSNLQASLGQQGAEWAAVYTGSVNLYNTGGIETVIAPSPLLTSSYALVLPSTQGSTGDLLYIQAQSGSSDELGWTTISAIVSGTSCNLPGHVVARDSTGSFAATTITLDGTPSLVNYSTIGGCDTGVGYIWTPSNENTIIGLNAGNSGTLTGSGNVAVGYDALVSITAGYDNVALGSSAGSSVTSGTGNIFIGANAGNGYNGDSSIFIGYTQTATAVGNNAIYIGNPSITPGNGSCANSATTTTIYGCITLPEVNCGTGYIASFDANGQLLQARSSRAYKENIVNITPDFTNRVYALQPVSFSFKNRPTETAFGLIAEDTHEICPELVIYNDAGKPDSVNYLSVQILALDALIKQREQISMLEKALSDQQKAVVELQQKIAQLLQ